jgi:hypothetical protein
MTGSDFDEFRGLRLRRDVLQEVAPAEPTLCQLNCFGHQWLRVALREGGLVLRLKHVST